jgi:hypothetical protein
MSEPFIVDLSLSRELQREQDRRAAVRLDHQDLQILADKLICDWYANQTVIDSAFRHIAELQVQLALATAKPSRRDPESRHFQWARDLLGKRD